MAQQVMSLVNEVALRGTDWEKLLVETLSLLHQIAMLQLLPSENNPQEQFTQERLRLLAKSVSPQDLQLYYQTFISWAKRAGLCARQTYGCRNDPSQGALLFILKLSLMKSLRLL